MLIRQRIRILTFSFLWGRTQWGPVKVLVFTLKAQRGGEIRNLHAAAMGALFLLWEESSLNDWLQWDYFWVDLSRIVLFCKGSSFWRQERANMCFWRKGRGRIKLFFLVPCSLPLQLPYPNPDLHPIPCTPALFCFPWQLTYSRVSTEAAVAWMLNNL